MKTSCAAKKDGLGDIPLEIESGQAQFSRQAGSLGIAMPKRPPTNKQLGARSIYDHALELLQDRGVDKMVSKFVVKEVIVEPFTVWLSVTGVDIWHEGSGKVFNMAKRGGERYEIVSFRRGVWEDTFLQLDL